MGAKSSQPLYIGRVVRKYSFWICPLFQLTGIQLPYNAFGGHTGLVGALLQNSLVVTFLI